MNSIADSDLATLDARDSDAVKGPRVTVNGLAVTLADWSPTGRQVLTAASLHPAGDYVLLQLPTSGPTEEIGPEETATLTHNEPSRFFAWKTDRVYYFLFDELKFPWTSPLDESMLRALGRVSDEVDVWLERKDEPDVRIERGATIDLAPSGVERLYTRPRSWTLDVQGVVIESSASKIGVRDALVRAGINPDQGWIIILKIAKEPKQQVELTDEIDLSRPGIERLRLTPKQINNGEATTLVRRQFPMLPADEAYLTGRGLNWQTIDEGRRWLLIADYPLPEGYDRATVDIAIEVSPTYPASELDMFYCLPTIALRTGVPIPQTEHREPIDGATFQRWSRHREPGTWLPAHDSLITHLGLVDESLYREVGQ